MEKLCNSDAVMTMDDDGNVRPVRCNWNQKELMSFGQQIKFSCELFRAMNHLSGLSAQFILYSLKWVTFYIFWSNAQE